MDRWQLGEMEELAAVVEHRPFVLYFLLLLTEALAFPGSVDLDFVTGMSGWQMLQRWRYQNTQSIPLSCLQR